MPRLPPIAASFLVCLLLCPAACKSHADEARGGAHEKHHTLVATNPTTHDVTRTEEFVCQIHSRRHIELRALERGYLESVEVNEGQMVKKGQLLFKILPVVYKAKLHADQAELLSAEISLRNSEKLFAKDVVSDQELALARAEQEKAKAKVELAKAELSFTEIRAPFDGMIDRQFEQQGSLVEEGDMLTTLSDNEIMWVYFNVPEADYLGFKAAAHSPDPDNPQRLVLPDTKIELELANGEVFDHDAGNTVTIESNFNSETGNIQFRADFPNPTNLLRHGQTGTLLIHRKLKAVVVIPQRATFEILDKQYVYVVDANGVAHQRAITIAHETDDLFVVANGLTVDEKIILDGIREVHDGEHVDVEFRDPADVLAHLKHHAE